MTKRLRLAAALIFIITTFRAYAADIKGKVTDSTTGEPLIGATIQIDGTPKATATDIDGLFAFSGLDENANYTLTIKYISYKTKKLTGFGLKLSHR